MIEKLIFKLISIKSFEDKPNLKSIFSITPVCESEVNNIEHKAPLKTDEILNQVVQKIESNQLKIDENIKPTCSNDLNFRGYSYEVSIKLNNSREQLQGLTYFESVETLDSRKDCGEKMKIVSTALYIFK